MAKFITIQDTGSQKIITNIDYIVFFHDIENPPYKAYIELSSPNENNIGYLYSIENAAEIEAKIREAEQSFKVICSKCCEESKINNPYGMRVVEL